MATIYLVDDEPDLRFLISLVLEKKGHTVRTFEDGTSVLEKLQKPDELPDLFILDVMLGRGINGWEVGRRIKENPRSRDIPVLFLTVKAEEYDLLTGFEYSHGDAYIKKPMNLEELERTVENLVETRP